MPEYVVRVNRVEYHTATYIVDADSEDKAEELVLYHHNDDRVQLYDDEFDDYDNSVGYIGLIESED